MNIDQVFKSKIEKSTDFKFDKKVVDVFDNMVVRSVPFYLEMQRMITELAKDYAIPGTSLYDLGCSTGTTMLSLDKVVDTSIKFVGIDNSNEMLEMCRSNFIANNVRRDYELQIADLNRNIELQNASVVVLCLTLQFVRPVNRFKLLQSAREQLVNGGCLILVEKLLAENETFNRQMIKYYYDFKRRNSYDDMEISQKREALENVLIPYRLSEDHQLLLEAGFSSVETFFKWYNFSGMIAFK
jgi:tRNA (cmo5U34)-methyltransferase